MKLALVIAALAACGRASYPTNAPGVRITDGKTAREFSQRAEHIASGFQLVPQGVNGTAIVLAYLENAQARGARYVSDLAIAVQLDRGDGAVECVSKIRVANGNEAPPPAPPPEPPLEPGEHATVVTAWRPAEIDAVVDDRDLACKQVADQVIVDEPMFENRLDVDVARYIEPGTMPHQRTGKLEWSTRCQSVSTRRRVHRYEHFVAAKFTPPDWPAIGHAYSDWQLVEAAPECHPIPKTRPRVPRIEADLHFTGELGTTLPKVWRE